MTEETNFHNRLQIIDGIKSISFLFSAIYCVAYYVMLGFYTNILNSENVAQDYTMALFGSTHFFVNNFIFLNTFCAVQRFLDDKEVKIREIVLRKWVRIAVYYYPIWILIA